MFSQKYLMDSGQQFKFSYIVSPVFIQNKPSTVNVEYCSVFDHEEKLWCFMPAHFSAIWQIFKLEASFTSWTIKNFILFFYVHDLYNDLTHPLFFTYHFYDKQIALFYDATMEKFFLVLTQNYWSGVFCALDNNLGRHTMAAIPRFELLLTSFLNCAKSDWKYVAVLDLLILQIEVSL